MHVKNMKTLYNGLPGDLFNVVKREDGRDPSLPVKVTPKSTFPS